MTEHIHICLDKTVPLELRELAQQLAVETNPANARQESGLELAAETGCMWLPGSTLRVRFLGGDRQVRAKIEQYAHEWEQYANIRFRFVSFGRAEIRVAFIEESGSWSYVGANALAFSDQQIPTMNFGWLDRDTPEEEYSRVVLHEFGHALGCIHEHNHPQHGISWDIEKAYEYYGQQGWAREEVDVQVFQKYSETLTQFSIFDPSSIMMYPIPAEITLDSFSVGWNTRLSEHDKQFIGQLYPFAA